MILPLILNLCQIHKKEHNAKHFVEQVIHGEKIQAMSSFDHDTSFFLDQPQPLKWNGLPDIQKKTLALAE